MFSTCSLGAPIPQPIPIEILDPMCHNLAALAIERAIRLTGMRYCDLGIQVREEPRAWLKACEDVFLMHKYFA